MMKKFLLSFVCAVVLFIIMISVKTDFIQRVTPFWPPSDHDITCYDEPSMEDSLPDLSTNADMGKWNQGKNIFFHETSCFNKDGLILNPRQACAVESAAKMNPKFNVFLFFVSNSKISNQSREIFNQLESYPNIKIRRIFPKTYMKDTPLELWFTSGVLRKSQWPRSHMSDILRYLTLWKYGGIYMDLDVVVTTSLEPLTDFAGAEDPDDVAAGVLGFGATTLGRRLADACLRDLKKNFRGDVWGNNGPGVITRTLQKICSTKYTRDMTTPRCHGFKVFPPSAFYPIHYKNWKRYFETTNKNATMKILDRAMAIHVWNKLSKFEKVHVDSDVPYAIIARKFCPKVFNNCGPVF